MWYVMQKMDDDGLACTNYRVFHSYNTEHSAVEKAASLAKHTKGTTYVVFGKGTAFVVSTETALRERSI